MLRFTPLLLVCVFLFGCEKKPSSGPPTVDSDSIAFSTLHFRQKTLSDKNKIPRWKPVRQWTPVTKRIEETLFERKSHPLTPLDEIRILVVLKEQFNDIGPVPVRLQLVLKPERNNHITKRQPGPVYFTETRPLTEDDLLDTDLPAADKKAYAGRQGVVFKPDYSIVNRRFHGTKPLGDSLTSTGEVWAAYKQDKLLAYYSFEITLDDNPDTTQTLSIGWKDNEVSAIDAYPVDIHAKRLHAVPFGKRGRMVERYSEFYFIDNTVLFDSAKTIGYTRLLDHIGTTWLFMRVRDRKGNGMNDYVLPHSHFKDEIADGMERLKSLGIDMRVDTKDDIIYLDRYDWQTPVEFVVFFNCGDQAVYKYQQVELNYREVPITATLHNLPSEVVGPDTPVINGPDFRSKLINFGEKLFFKGQYFYRREDRTNRYRFKRPIDKLLKKYPFLVPERPPAKKFRYYYGAHFTVDFGKIKKDIDLDYLPFKTDSQGYYRFFLSFDTGHIGFHTALNQFPIYIKAPPAN